MLNYLKKSVYVSIIQVADLVSSLVSLLINKKITDPYNKTLSDKQYRFRFYGSTADVLTIITQRISKALYHKLIPRATALYILKVFDKM